MGKFKKTLISLLILGIFVVIARGNFVRLSPFFKTEIEFAKKTFFSNNEEKLAAHIGEEVLNYIRFTSAITPPSSHIMIPPQQNPWPVTGNREFMQYFYYPKQLIHESLTKVDSDQSLTHILIAWGELPGYNSAIRGWPKFFIPARKIYFPEREKTINVSKITVSSKNLNNLFNFEPETERGLQPLPKLINLASNVDKSQVKKKIVEDEKSILTEQISANYTSAGFDYWGQKTKIPLTSDIQVQAKISTRLLNSASLVAKVDYEDGTSAFFSSKLNQSNQDEILAIDNLYEKATKFAKDLNLSSSDKMSVVFVGFDLGHLANFPYLEKWGIAELEKGDLNLNDIKTQNSFSYAQMATKDLVLKNFDEAIENSKLAISLDENFLWPKVILAESYFRSERFSEAKSEYDEILNFDPNFVWGYFQIGRIYQNLGKTELALENFLKAHEVASEPSWINLAIAQTYEKLNDLVNASEYYRLAASNNAYIFTQAGAAAQERLLAIKAEQRNVIVQKEIILKQNPNDLQANVDLTNAYLILGKNDLATKIYQKLVQIYPSLPLPEPVKGKLLVSFVDSFENSTIGKDNLDGYRDFIKGVSGLAVDFGQGEYISYQPEILPKTQGTIEFFWRPAESLTADNERKFTTLLYQPGATNLTNGLFVFANYNYFAFGIFDSQNGKWHFIKSAKMNFSPDLWYKIRISFGPAGMHLALNDSEFINTEFKGGIGQNQLFLGNVQGYFAKLPVIPGSFDELKFSSIQKLE